MDRTTVAYLAFSIIFTEALDQINTEKSENFGEMIQYRDGDILLAVFLSIGQQDLETEQCINQLDILASIAVEQINMVVEQVNRDDSLLKGVKLGTFMINTCGSEAHALEKLVLNVLRNFVIDGRDTSDGKPKRILAGIIGATRSSVSRAMARIAQIFQIPQISFWSTNPDLSDKVRFKYFFRTCPPDNYQALAMAEFAKQQGWNYVSIVYDDDVYGVAAKTELVNYLQEKGICVATMIRITSDFDANSVIQQLMMKSNARAVFIISSSETAEPIIQAAHWTPEVGSRFTWVGSDYWAGYIPTNIVDRTYLDTLDGAIGFQLKYPSAKGFEDYLTSLTLEERQGENRSLNPWWEHFISHVKNCSVGNEISEKRACDSDEKVDDQYARNAGVTEAVMAFAHALDSYLTDECGIGEGLCQKIQRAAGTNKVACNLYEYLKEVSFPTSEGIFEFDENQDGPPLYDVHVFDKNLIHDNSVIAGWTKSATFNGQNITWIDLEQKLRTAATYSKCSQPCESGQIKVFSEQTCCWTCLNCSEFHYVSNETKCSRCPTGYIPDEMKNQCIAMPVRRINYGSALALAMLIAGIIGLVCTAVVTLIYLKNMDTAIVKASGKELCFFVLVGVFITLLSSFTICATPSPLSCGATRVILCIGPVVMYAGLLMKTFRVVFIFQSNSIWSTRTKAYLEPLPLLLLTLCVCMVQVVICVIWLIINVPTEKIYYTEYEGILACKNLLDVQIFVGLAYPFLIIIVCTILATINRTVPTGFRETLFVGFTMYITCVTWIAFLPLFFTNSSDISKKETTLSLALSVSAMAVLFCLFGPRCYTILFHPTVNTPESVMAAEASFSTIVRQQTLRDAEEEDRSSRCAGVDGEAVQVRCRTNPSVSQSS